MKRAHKIEEAVCTGLPGSECKAIESERFVLMEVVWPHFTVTDPAADQRRVAEAVDVVKAGAGLWLDSMFLYRDGAERFTEHATLHTIAAGYTPDGVWSTSLSSADAYILVAELDAECLMTAVGTGETIEGLVLRAVEKGGSMPFVEGIQFCEVEILGHSAFVQGASKHEEIICVTLAGWNAGNAWQPITRSAR